MVHGEASAVPAARFTQSLQQPCSTSKLPALSRCLSNLCQPKSSAFAPKGQRASVEWVGGAQRWRFRPSQSPSRQQVREAAAAQGSVGSRVIAKPKSCSHAMHPVTAARWDLRAKSEADLVLKRYGYFPGQPRERAGRDSSSRLSDFIPAAYRAYSSGPVLDSAKAVPRAAKEAQEATDNPEDESLVQALVPSTQEEGAEASAAKKQVELKTMSDIRILKYGPEQEDRLVVKRWRPGHADKAALARFPISDYRGLQPKLWQNDLRNSVFNNLVTFGGTT
eukprot:TRINITY_DN37145_c0_g1_i1.p1 TRINITY_DN37145_c0_g1~~TRINITY_DN37145_c0_g1_i1.p1  ORF type:complete len:297 (-),score=60.42 TRINITY_DN37145_c0_g1_i1:25-861(-)